MDWFVLGIEPTKDKKAITAAYRQKLRQTNPEDKPEEFKALRAAYEEALALADRADEAVCDDTPVGRWIAAVARVYDNFAARIDPESWKKLTTDDVCMGLDTRMDAEQALMQFLLEHYYLPRPVWHVLNDAFGFTDRLEELYEVWPRDFVDYVLVMGLKMEHALDFERFTPGVNGPACDAYRRLFQQAHETPPEEAGELLDQMERLPEQHPYGKMLRCHHWMETGQKEAAMEGFRALSDRYPEDPILAVTWAEICLGEGNVAQAQRLAEQVLANRPTYPKAKLLHARCLAQQGDYQQAKDLIFEVMQLESDNPPFLKEATELLNGWNTHIIGQREETRRTDPDNMENNVELAWCYAQSGRVEEAMELALTVDPDYEDAFGYHNLMGKLFHNTDRYAEALPHLEAAEAALRTMTDDGTRKTARRLTRLPEMLQFQGNCLMRLGRTEEAGERFEAALALEPNNEELLSSMGKMLLAAGRYHEAAEAFRRLTALAPTNWVALLLLSMCLYQLRQDPEAYDAICRAMELQGQDLTVYLLKMQILVRNNGFEEVRETLKLLREGGAPETLTTEFIRAQLTELEQRDAKAALEQYRDIQKRVEQGEELLFVEDLYCRLAVLTGNQSKISREEDRKAVLELIDKGLSHQANHADLLSYKAWVLRKAGLDSEAMEMYRSLERRDSNDPVALRGIAELYYSDMDHHADKALSYYEKLLETQHSPELYFYAASCKRHMGDVEGAKAYYLKELEMDPEDIDGHQGLAFVCETLGDCDAALNHMDRALAIMEEFGQHHVWLVEHKAKLLRRMGRVQEALAFVREAAEKYRYDGAFQLQFDICCQFGLWDQAKQVLDAWKRADKSDPDLMAATANYHLLRGKMFQAAAAMAPAKHKLPHEQIQDFRLQLAELECNYTRQTQLLTERLRRDPGSDHTLIGLAFALWHMGQEDAARKAARKALELLDELVAGYTTAEPLYRSRRCLALAILGRTEEARAELALARNLPLCSFCAYGSCKDADIYEAHIEELLGNKAEAARLYAEGRKKWPDDLDFISGEARMKKKGRK